jgi:hypothetical protein
LFLHVARHSIINLYHSLLAHHSKLDPVPSSIADYRNTVLLRVNPLVNLLFGVDVSHISVFDEVELRSEPFDEAGHCGLISHIESVLDN